MVMKGLFVNMEWNIAPRSCYEEGEFWRGICSLALLAATTSCSRVSN